MHDQAGVQSSQVSGNTLTIGRGTGNTLVLDDLHIALRHAEIGYVNGRYVIKALSPDHKVYVNHRAVNLQPLSNGQVIHIGSYDLRIRLVPGHESLSVEVLPQNQAEATNGTTSITYVARYRLSTGRWTKTRLTLLGLALGVALPALLLWFERVPFGDQTWRTSSILAPGQVTQAHSFIGTDCTKCHVEAWGAPTTNACTTCHSGPLHHANQMFTPACVSCHREHRNDQRSLTTMVNAVCTTCHAALQTESGQPSQFAANIRTFAEGHPEFAVTLRSTEEPGVRRVRLNDQALRDPTALKLNHALHLTPERMTAFGFKPLTCASCHKLDEQGASLSPITYAERCASCHLLEFDARFPGQVVPHGQQPEDIQNFLKQNFAQRCLERFAALLPTAPADGESAVRPRRPGQALPALRELTEATAAQVLQCRDEGVGEAQKRLYTGGQQAVCGLCHTLQEHAGAGQLPTVQAPRIPERWFVHGEFHHLVHVRTTKRAATSQHLCETCHSPALAASQSTQTSDVLLPNIQVCQHCHSETGGAHLQCAACHQYHDESIRKPF
jgi:predicted CXXCH cytochrome family protein